jgi:hypothetical protein
MKVIIAGGRTFNDYELLRSKVDYFLSNQTEIEIVSGTANGADKLGERYAAERCYLVKRFIPDWNFYGKKAGYIRNEDMAKYADALICFWDGKSRGSKHMIDIAKRYELKIRVVKY